MVLQCLGDSLPFRMTAHHPEQWSFQRNGTKITAVMRGNIPGDEQIDRHPGIGNASAILNPVFSS